MRGKRGKQYRKLIEQFARGFGFREPYQVILDASMVSDAVRCKMELVSRLTQTLHGEVKPLITQCSIRHLYAASTSAASPAERAGVAPVIELAKTFERRRCDHHPDTHPEPLPEGECIASVVGPTNKHRYMVASQDVALRRDLSGVAGVPLVYVNRSVMILEPMADATKSALDREERAKFRGGLRPRAGVKRKRDEGDEREDALGGGGKEMGDRHEEDAAVDAEEGVEGADGAEGEAAQGERRSDSAEAGRRLRKAAAARETTGKKTKNKRYGRPRGPNPLSNKRSKNRSESS